MMKRYLGDAVYADYDGEYIILTTENGERTDNIIYLDERVLDTLDRYRGWLKERHDLDAEESRIIPGED